MKETESFKEKLEEIVVIVQKDKKWNFEFQKWIWIAQIFEFHYVQDFIFKS